MNDIPRFFLYGEPPRSVEDHFLHLESIDLRTRPANWNIRPHTHANLCHVFHIEEGAGEMRVDDGLVAFQAPCLLLVPPRTVHGFAFASETRGSVLTLSDAYLHELLGREPAFARIFLKATALSPIDNRLVTALLNSLSRELAWTAIGHAVAVEALLICLLVETLRLVTHDEGAGRRHAIGPHAALVARLRQLIEDRFRTGDTVEHYASTLGVTTKVLRNACLSVACAPPLRLLQDRVVLEAKRALLYSNKTISEVAYDLGFEDPAYFSRFFARAEGRSPREFRNAAAERRPAEVGTAETRTMGQEAV